MSRGTLLVLAGDVMTGRGVDQILPSPGPPRLHEEYVVDARSYVELAEKVNGPIARPVDPAWPWGDALAVMEAAAPNLRVMNLETSVTRSDELEHGKGIHYRMNPANLSCLSAAAVDVWSLANNHVLDHGMSGLLETLESMRAGGLRTAGAGIDDVEAWRPAVVEHVGGRVVVCCLAHVSSGVPPSWAAGAHRPGVALLPGLSDGEAEHVGRLMRQQEQPGDLRVASVHWGGNWGYDVPDDHRRFAHRLIDTGVHVVHGHSSHHPRPVEVYRGRLVLYGCGDLVDDYEGISGYEGYRDDLRLLYLPRLDAETGELLELSMVPFQARQMRLWRADRDDADWLARRLDRASRPLGASIVLAQDDSLSLRAGG
ncbi:MAG TPA: CapA family protein [Nocardioidaceae bacterium]|nr:CapA family protein [Nocardioidaceae bacterium]